MVNHTSPKPPAQAVGVGLSSQDGPDPQDSSSPRTRAAGRKTGSRGFPALILGAFAVGWTALAIDAVLLRVVLGAWVPPTLGLVLAYTVSGVVVALVAVVAGFLLPRVLAHPDRAWWALSLGLVVVYSLVAWERAVYVVESFKAGPSAVIPPLLGALVALAVAFAVWVAVKVASARRHAWLGPWAVAIAMAVVLAGNRSLVPDPLSPVSIGFDLLCSVVALISVVVFRDLWFGDRQRLWPVALSIVLSSVVLAACGLLALRTFDDQSTARRIDQRVAGLGTDSAADLDGGGGRRDRERRGDRADRALAPPNIVLIVLDTMRADVFYDVLAETPEGKAFDQALGPAVWFTQNTAVGAATPPTMSTLLTGLWPPQHGVDGSASSNWLLKIRPNVTLLAQRLQDHGYQTISYVANGALQHSVGVHRGIDSYTSLRPTVSLYPLGLPTKRLLDLEWSGLATADEARLILVSSLRRHPPKEGPTFLWYHLMDTHQPIEAHPEIEHTSGDNGLTDEQLEYRTAARFALGELAKTLPTLHRLFPPSNTAYVVIADHGELLTTDGKVVPGRTITRGHSHSYYEGIVHIPLGIQPPGGLGSSRTEETLVSQVDFAPTVLEWAGIEVPSDLPGCSLVAIVDGEQSGPPCHQFVVSTANTGTARHKALRTPLLKVIVADDGSFPPELYELSSDPTEQHNVAAQRSEALDLATRLIGEFWARYATEGSSSPAKLDQATIDQLRAIGYLQ